MSTRAIVFAAAVVAGSLFAFSALAIEGATTGEAPLRVGPGEEFARIGAINAGSALKIHSCRDGQAWCLVRVSGRSGWVPGELVKAGGFSKAKTYFDPAAKVSLQYDVNDRELFDDTLLGPRGVPIRRPFRRLHDYRELGARDFRMHPYSRFPDYRTYERTYGAHSFPVYPLDDFHRSRLSDKQLPKSFRSTIHPPGFRLHKQGFPNFIDN